jgi:diguanylate cyclase (GGDEF)-like protein
LGTKQPDINDAVWDRSELASAYERAACVRLAAERIARSDALTGLANRRAAIDALEAEVARAQRERGALGVFLFDVDRFKVVNDRFGHDAGDRVLVAIANRVRAATSSSY